MHEAQRGNFSWNVLSCFLNDRTLSQICNCLSSKCNEKKKSKSKHLLVRVGVVVTTQRKLTTKQSKAERQQHNASVLPLPFMKSKLATVKRRKCSIKLPKHELTVVRRNTWWTIPQNMGPNENYIVPLCFLPNISQQVSKAAAAATRPTTTTGLRPRRAASGKGN